MVIAVVDSGYRPHPDLVANLLPGYDFISDPLYANAGLTVPGLGRAASD